MPRGFIEATLGTRDLETICHLNLWGWISKCEGVI